MYRCARVLAFASYDLVRGCLVTPHFRNTLEESHESPSLPVGPGCSRVGWSQHFARLGGEQAQAPQASPDTPLVAEKIRQLMQDRNYAEAIKAIDEAAAGQGRPARTIWPI